MQEYWGKVLFAIDIKMLLIQTGLFKNFNCIYHGNHYENKNTVKERRRKW